MRFKDKVFYLLCTLGYYASWAADTVGVQGLDDGISIWQRAIKVAAKWGGIAIFAIAGWQFGSAKWKGQTIENGVYVLGGVGLIWMGFSWWNGEFSSGFAF